MFRIMLAFTLASAVGGPARAASPDPSTLAVPPQDMARARELVRALGSDDYAEREDAQKALATMGRMARPVLAEAAFTNPSAEVRTRAARLLPRAEAEELKARLETFLADEQLRYEHELPGWAEFRVAAGAEWHLFGAALWRDVRTLKAARDVYVEMLDAQPNRDLVFAVGGPPTNLGPAVGARRVELYNVRMPVRPAGGGFSGQTRVHPIDVVALLFAESQVPSRHIPVTRAVSITILLTSLNSYGGDDRAAVCRNVAAYWMESRDDSASQYQALLAANSLNMPGPGTRVALKLLDDRKGLPMHRAQAVVHLVRFDARDALPAIEKAMTDPTVVTSFAVAANADRTYEPLQVRDVALAGALVMSGERPEDYGFVSRNGYNLGGRSLTSYLQWVFPADRGTESFILSQRALAFSKWAAWREQNRGADAGGTVK